jgi:hypothetical protein
MICVSFQPQRSSHITAKTLAVDAGMSINSFDREILYKTINS